MDQSTLRHRREAVVREHMESENVHEFDVTMATFEHPRYEIVPTGEVFDGEAQVAEYFRRTRAAFPDQRNENAVLHHADDAVIVEFDLLGTHEGELRGMRADRQELPLPRAARSSCSSPAAKGSSASASTSTRRRSRSSCSSRTRRRRASPSAPPMRIHAIQTGEVQIKTRQVEARRSARPRAHPRRAEGPRVDRVAADPLLGDRAPRRARGRRHAARARARASRATSRRWDLYGRLAVRFSVAPEQEAGAAPEGARPRSGARCAGS